MEQHRPTLKAPNLLFITLPCRPGRTIAICGNTQAHIPSSTLSALSQGHGALIPEKQDVKSP